MFQRILLVCIGNICRSPVAEAMLRTRLPEREFSSAGLGALVGRGADPTARALAETEGFDVSQHQARQLTPAILQGADLILVMSDGQRRAVADIEPAAMGKTMLLGRWLDGGKGREIPDPYGKSREAFEHAHQLIKDATEAWTAKL
ncbi:low molecular weight phosphotyrosine protein phosphatase [Halomonas sp. M5N1S17]|uniref:low molecular weight protein-tyrosine-phosphatase n=1 Tax=Halomonas alkalisoli TaxID=2907158 RepID=UPI001F465DC8|nr:low molecular weight protein-tyrosine-phosphatase [Halomonas alkalisoli]MCE9664979.1 low molecular weight phosphotyrosine protein phosphatase [Halomonas alkalisoli]